MSKLLFNLCTNTKPFSTSDFEERRNDSRRNHHFDSRPSVEPMMLEHTLPSDMDGHQVWGQNNNDSLFDGIDENID